MLKTWLCVLMINQKREDRYSTSAHVRLPEKHHDLAITASWGESIKWLGACTRVRIQAHVKP